MSSPLFLLFRAATVRVVPSYAGLRHLPFFAAAMAFRPASVSWPPGVTHPARRSAISVDLCPPMAALPFRPCQLSRPAAIFNKARYPAGDTTALLSVCIEVRKSCVTPIYYGLPLLNELT